MAKRPAKPKASTTSCLCIAIVAATISRPCTGKFSVRIEFSLVAAHTHILKYSTSSKCTSARANMQFRPARTDLFHSTQSTMAIWALSIYLYIIHTYVLCQAIFVFGHFFCLLNLCCNNNRLESVKNVQCQTPSIFSSLLLRLLLLSFIHSFSPYLPSILSLSLYVAPSLALSTLRIDSSHVCFSFLQFSFLLIQFSFFFFALF